MPHILQPKHTKLSEKEAEELLKRLNVSRAQIPKILINDPALPGEIKIGDVIKIERRSEETTSVYYRVVV